MNYRMADQYLELSKGRIYAKSWHQDHEATREPLILLHDSLGCVAMWRDFPAQLCRILNRTVIAYDRLGFGRSSEKSQLPPHSFIADEALIVGDLADRLGIERFALLGHSVGGAMAIQCAAAMPDRCEAAVTISAQAFVEPRTVEGVAAAKEFFKDTGQRERLSRYHGEKTGWVLDAWTETWLSPEFASWTLFDALGQTKCPVLAIHGAEDEYGSVRFPETIRDLAVGRSAMVLLSNCGHMPHREQPDVVINHIDQFFQEHTDATEG